MILTTVASAIFFAAFGHKEGVFFPLQEHVCHTTVDGETSGRLGNDLYRYVSGEGAAAKMGCRWCAPVALQVRLKVNGFDVPSTPCSVSRWVAFNEKDAWTPVSFNELKRHENVRLSGYLQSWSYHEHKLSKLKYSAATQAACDAAVAQVCPNGADVSMHVRGGDAISRGIPPRQKHFLPHVSGCVVVVSDEPRWVSHNLPSSVHFIRKTPAIDMCVAGSGRKIVLTAGTFDIFAAYFRKYRDAKIVMDRETFRLDMLKGVKAEQALASYVPKEWIAQYVLEPSQIDWELNLPRKNTAHDWCPQNSRAWINNLYHEAAAAHATKCSSVVRVGGSGDGGKFICADKMQRNDCVVYSLGSRLDFSFEIAIVAEFGCKVHTFDCTVGVPASSVVPRGVSFHPWCVGGRDELKPISSDLGHQGEIGQYYTLQTIQGKLGHARIDLLKMDIERHEFDVVQSLSRRALPTQIAFETHVHNAYGMWKRPVAQSEWEAMWSKLSGLSYGVFSYEPNPKCLCCCEWSLLVT